MKYKDLSGQKFNRLMVIEFAGRKNNQYIWKCQCDCGNIVFVERSKLKSGHTKSCGCLARENSRKQKKHNKYQIFENHVEVNVSNKIMLCDIEDWDKLKNHHWFVNKLGYAAGGTIEEGTFLFHKKVTNTTNEIVDHINQNKLDNRKCNLRVANKAINSINRGIQSNNTTGYKGVGYDGRYNTWFARVCVKGKIIHLGTYSTKEQAIEARKRGEEQYYKPQLDEAVCLC